ncbi:hypothetical protein ACEP27_01635 [Pseudomonas aeruginosa]|uniref:hypothetical protein n=1 Tax=Pseudomonas aeruginosa TaxID=287 RepID=UPI000936ADE6|nr:hypothetical protein [Pseudomonas aeruginosa]MCT5749995.1 hypothetical protein [Pseudomonas aeruginosa]
MSKIIQAVNVMITNEQKISSVLPGQLSGEIFFLFNKKHKWSIYKQESGEYFLTYYPGPQPLEYFADMSEEDAAIFTEVVIYNSKSIGTKEGYASLKELYTILQEKLYGMDKVLNDIIESDDIPF